MRRKLTNLVRRRKLKNTLKLLVSLLILLSIIFFVATLLIREFKKTKKIQTEKKEEKALAIISGFLIDEEGNLIRRSKADEDLPKIIANLPPIYGGEKIEGGGIKVTLDLIKELKEKSLMVKSAKLYNEQLMELGLEDKTKVLYNTEINPAETALSLQIMLSRFKIEGKTPKEIDFRFGKPVVRF